MSTTHNFALSEEQAMVLETVRKLVEDEIAPAALEHDEHRRFARPAFDRLAELGMLGLPVAEASGGAGMGWLALAVALEELAAACGSTARLLLSQAGLCGKALEGHELCAAVAAGERLGAFVGLEHGVVARAAGGAFRLTGAAPMVTAAAAAELLVVAATGEDAQPLLFAVDAAGIERPPAAALGFRASAPGSLELKGHEVQASALVKSGDAARAALDACALAAGIGGGAIGVGLALASYELSRRYAGERVAFGSRRCGTSWWRRCAARKPRAIWCTTRRGWPTSARTRALRR
jgi:alkylation response protein AidB-like acyl-CoA dehydrogenase